MWHLTIYKTLYIFVTGSKLCEAIMNKGKKVVQEDDWGIDLS